MMNRDWFEKDFYAILGVPKTATDKDIKRAYRRLAQEHHPDANPGNKDAEERFKEVSEAYSVLGHEDRRKEYDQAREMFTSGGFRPGGAGPGGFGGGGVRFEDLSDLLSGFGGLGDLFGGFAGGRRGPGPQRGQDLFADVNLAFTEAVDGATVPVSIDGEAVCRTCGGNGAAPGTPVTTCSRCGGSGMMAVNQGPFSISEPCDLCHGTGRQVSTPCPTCRGRGTEVRSRTLKVRIPAGVHNGAVIRVKGKGGPGRLGGPAGDLNVRVHVGRHPLFHRKGDNLRVTVPITFTEAALGAEIEVPTLDGRVRLRIPAGTSSGKTFRVRSKGVPRKKGGHGDLLVTVEVAVPVKLDDEARELLEQLRTLEAGDVRAHLGV